MSISLQLFLFTCFALFGASASYSVAEEISQPLQIEAKSASSRAIACEEKKMDFVLYSDDTGSVCEPRKNTDLTTKIVSCLSVGMEAVLIPDRMGVVCTRPFLGEPFLEKEVRYAPPNMIDSKSICDQQNTPSADKRILDLRFIKELLRKSQSAIDSTGIRIIGGIYCDGVDLSGLDIPFSLILDRSVFMGRVNVRNFRSKGDFSIDESVLYGSLRINRSDISGSVYASFAFIRNMDISDSVVSGSIKLNNSFVFDLINIENVSVVGDLDISTSFVSNLEVLKDKIGGALDLSQSQARCSYDIRKNEIGDMVAVKLGFGSVNGGIHTFKDISTDAAFGRPLPPARRSKDKKALADPYTQYGDLASQTARVIQETKACDAPNLIKPGTFLIGDNHIKSSLCIRSFNWLTDPDNNPQKSNIYLNEDNISGATWLNIIQRQAEPTGSGAPSRSHSSDAMLSIFNVKTGTLVLNFDVTAQNVSLTVNGLHFERIYDSKADCESALSARSSGSVPTRAGAQASKEIPFSAPTATAEDGANH